MKGIKNIVMDLVNPSKEKGMKVNSGKIEASKAIEICIKRLGLLIYRCILSFLNIKKDSLSLIFL
ncbi:MAG: hypothetical protein ACOC85_02140 [Thermoplasmatota archaeon]